MLDHLDQILQQTGEAMRHLGEARARIQAVSGENAVDDMVRVRAGGDGRLTEITLNPRIRRLDAAALSAKVTQAIQQAQDDAERKSQEIVQGALGRTAALPPPLDETFVRDRVTQVARELDQHE